MERKPAHRFKRVPRTLKSGKPWIITPRSLTTHDLAILAALRRYRFLNADYIAAIAGSSSKYCRERLVGLCAEGNNYVKVADWQTENPRANLYTTNFYELDVAGMVALEEEGFAPIKRQPPKQYIHQVMLDQVDASFEIGTKDHPKLKLGAFADILEKVPQKTRTAKHPKAMSVNMPNSQGEIVKTTVVKDGDPRYIERIETGDYFFIPGLEVDTGSMPIDTYDLERSSIFRHFSQDLAILDQEIYRSHFGAENCFFPYIFTTQSRKNSALGLLERMTQHKPSLRKHFLFTTHPKLTMREKAMPSGRMIEPWERVQYAPLDFLKD
jgi:hypothetical protein